jgi:UDP-2,3-diacylglucosamine pyrophosphatase LpxH
VITTVREQRMLVVSDVHLGNPLYRARQPFVEVLRYAYANDLAVCINGDGVDIAQLSLPRLARDLAGCNREFARFARRGLPIYYTVGNHDMALEQFLEDWGVLRVVPFLNLVSGDRRIRIEHGHVYDAMFVKYPKTYTVMTTLGALTLRLSPRTFRSLEIFNTALIALGEWWNADRDSTDSVSVPVRPIPGERPAFVRAALEITERGFDAVIFGHTHCCGHVQLPNGASYYNTGLWHTDPHFAEVDRGQVTLRPLSAIRTR